ncbi:Protocadherin-7, partial [Cichlidogyrus casuarinus]
ARDPDQSRELAYSLNNEDQTVHYRSGNRTSTMPKQPWFSVNAKSGEVRTLISFDAELVSHVTVSVAVTDSKFAANATLQVFIEDENDCEPQFASSVFTFRVREDARPQLKLGTVKATDCDVSDRNSKLIYSLHSMEDIGLEPGVVQFANRLLNWLTVNSDGDVIYKESSPYRSNHGESALDRDKYQKNEYRFLLGVRDGGSPSRNSSAVLELFIEDVNDNTPHWKFPSVSQQKNKVNLTYGMAEGSRIAQVSCDMCALFP